MELNFNYVCLGGQKKNTHTHKQHLNLYLALKFLFKYLQMIQNFYSEKSEQKDLQVFKYIKENHVLIKCFKSL